MAKALRERVGKQYTGTQRTRKAVHGECTVELAKWTFPIISRSREPYEVKVSRTGLTGGMGRRTVRQRALCLPSRGHRRVVRVSHTPKRPTSRKSTMVSRLLANPSIQISHGPPGGRRERLGAIPLTRRRKTDKHVTNGVGGSTVEGPRTLSREPQSLACS
jgi:hypothetical protein